MSETQIRFTFDSSVPLDEAEGTLHLARLAAESLHGSSRVALEARCRFDRLLRAVTIDASTDAGRTLALVFGGYLERDFGMEAVEQRIVSVRVD